MNSKICALVTSGIVSLLIGGPPPAYATTYYVPSQYSTVQAAYDVCNPGDTVVVANGTYTKSGQNDVLRMTSSGTAGAPITVEATNIGGAILDGQNLDGSDGYEATVYVTGSYNVLKGFKVKDGYFDGISIWSWAGGGTNNQILENEIYDNGNLNNGGSGNNGVIDDQNGTANNFYIANYIHDNGRISLGTNVDQGMYLCATNGDVVVNNLIVRNCADGIQVAGYNGIANMDIYNNTIVSNRVGDGIILWQTMNGVNIANNIVYGNAHYGIGTWACTGSGVQIDNNLFYDNGYGTWNMTLGGSTVSYATSGNITGSDPEFFDPASNWHLQKCSPAIDAGLTLGPIVTDDYDGLPRPIPVGGNYDIGAYER